MRILMCHNFYAQEGGENTVFRQAAEILRAHGETTRHYTRESTTIERADYAVNASIVFHGFYSPRTARELNAIINEFKPDVALVQNVFPLLSPAVYTTLCARGVPIAQLVFNYRFLCVNAQLYVNRQVCERCITGNFIHALYYRCLHHSVILSAWYASILGWHRRIGTFQRAIQRYIVPHPFVARKLVEGGFPSEQMRVNPNPFVLPPPAWTESPEPYIAYVGRVIPEKGILTLVQALERVPPPLKLSIIGDGEDLPKIKAYLAMRPSLAARVQLHGQLWGDANRAILAGAQAFVLPSEWHDVSPLLLYNALALGKPVIASHLGSQPEIVTDGVDGLIFQAGDIPDLASKIAQLASDRALRQRMGKAGRVKAEQTFTPEAHYERLRAILEEVCQ
jgi:glycosyltransferase involved in cell wall biosynthesis